MQPQMTDNGDTFPYLVASCESTPFTTFGLICDILISSTFHKIVHCFLSTVLFMTQMSSGFGSKTQDPSAPYISFQKSGLAIKASYRSYLRAA